jgi:hypothetical protein
MAFIRATCSDCGDVELRSHNLSLRICVETKAATYLFRCPQCSMTEVRNADPDVVEVLVSAGVSLTEWHLPAELGERPNGAPISHDDLLDFHALLDQDDWMTSLIATDELFRSFDKDEATPERG